MKNRYCSLLIIAQLVFSAPGHGQCTVQRVSGLPGQFYISDLWKISIINPTSTSIQAMVEIKIETQNHGLVIKSTTLPVTITPGLNYGESLIHATKANSVYGNNNSSSGLQQTGTLPTGNYIICATLLRPSDLFIEGQFCQEQVITGLIPPYLVSPLNDEQIFTHNPMLTWHGPVPDDRQMTTYEIRVVMVSSHQSKEQAIRRNAPVINLKNLKDEFIKYMPDYPALKTDSNYAWNITTSYDAMPFHTTETWDFKVRESSNHSPEEEVEVDSASYKMITEEPDGGYYEAPGELKFTYVNNANDTILDYTIFKAETMTTVPNTPSVALNYGLNKIDLDLSAVTALVDGEEYLINVTDGHFRTYILSFYYKLP